MLLTGRAATAFGSAFKETSGLHAHNRCFSKQPELSSCDLGGNKSPRGEGQWVPECLPQNECLPSQAAGTTQSLAEGGFPTLT